MKRLATSLVLIVFGATAGSAANASLAGDTVTAHVFELSANDDFSPTSAVVGPGVEFTAATFHSGVLLSLDMHANGFTLTYENTLASSFNEGLTYIEITDLDFSPAASVAGVSVDTSSWINGTFDDITFQPSSISIDLTNVDTEIPGNTTWTASFTITTPEPDGEESSAIALVALGALPLFGSRERAGSAL
jgi:hypothetical protein